MGFESGDIVIYQDDRTDRKQKVELLQKTTEPKWASEEDNVWEFRVVGDGPLFLEDEVSYIREEEIIELNE